MSAWIPALLAAVIPALLFFLTPKTPHADARLKLAAELLREADYFKPERRESVRGTLKHDLVLRAIHHVKAAQGSLAPFHFLLGYCAVYGVIVLTLHLTLDGLSRVTIGIVIASYLAWSAMLVFYYRSAMKKRRDFWDRIVEALPGDRNDDNGAPTDPSAPVAP